MAKMTFEDHELEFAADGYARDAVYRKVLQFFIDNQCYSGESIMQSDAPQIESPELLADLADNVFKFNVEWRENA